MVDEFRISFVAAKPFEEIPQFWVDYWIDKITVCIDDFGNRVFKCNYTGVFTTSPKLVGAIIPGVKLREAADCSAVALALRKASEQAFHESEMNCNTCSNLVRTKMPKNAGWLYGSCQKNPSLQFHPDDPMPENINCYVSRWENKE